MKLNELVKGALIAITGAAVLAVPTVFARSEGLEARSLRDVDTVWVDANVCLHDIRDELRQRGFFVTGNPRVADAALIVDVYDHDPGLRNTARYKARLEGRNASVLFSASGTESSRTLAGLCDNIGDNIAEAMDDMG